MPVNIVNTENFAELREAHGYYVDKTGFLVRLLQDPAKPGHFRKPADVSLFTRPRRFGKTLFMLMLAEFFDITKDSRELFAGLKVADHENLCTAWMNQYPVVFLTLKGIEAENYKDAVDAIRIRIGALYSQFDEVLNNQHVKSGDRKLFQKLIDCKTGDMTLRGALLFLTNVLFQHYSKPVILLIDEYDVPVSKAAEHHYYNRMIIFMRNFLSDALKTNSFLKFAIVTGALRITKESIFTGLNNMDCFDISTDKYSDVFGFTQEEVDQLLVCADLEDKREQLKEWYDGYHFGERKDIYCPWSIMKCLEVLQDNPRSDLEAYWVNTSSNELTKGYTDHVPANIQDTMLSLMAGNSISVQINEKLNYNQLYKNKNNFWTLLYLTGYLTTINDNVGNSSSSVYRKARLAIPNKEVREAFEYEIKSWFDDIIPDENQNEFFDLFWEADAPNFERTLNERLASSASIRDYRYKEHFYHSLMLGIFLSSYKVFSNREAGTGFFDLMVLDESDQSAAVIEIKRARSIDGLDACVQAALKQIEERQYDTQLRANGCARILHWGMAFFKKSCKVAVRLATPS